MMSREPSILFGSICFINRKPLITPRITSSTQIVTQHDIPNPELKVTAIEKNTHNIHL